MRESVVVIKKDAAGIAVKMQSSFSCEGCNACHIEQGKDHILLIQQEFPVQPGEKVEIEINPRFTILAIFLIFFLPLVMLIVGYYLFQTCADNFMIIGYYNINHFFTPTVQEQIP